MTTFCSCVRIMLTHAHILAKRWGISLETRVTSFMRVTDTVCVLFFPHTHCDCYDVWQLNVKVWLIWLQYVHSVAHVKTKNKLKGESVLFSRILFSLPCCTVRRKMEAIFCCDFIKNVYLPASSYLNSKYASPLKGEVDLGHPHCQDAPEGYTAFISWMLHSQLQLSQSTFYSKPFPPHFSLNVIFWLVMISFT